MATDIIFLLFRRILFEIAELLGFAFISFLQFSNTLQLFENYFSHDSLERTILNILAYSI